MLPVSGWEGGSSISMVVKRQQAASETELQSQFPEQPLQGNS